ncbi:MAG: hypothetical protein ACRCY4_02830 [Brevinema sp.]
MDAVKLQEIRQAEQKAAQLIASTEEEVQTLARQARADAQKAMEDAKQFVRKHEADTVATFHKQGAEQAEKILSSLNNDLSQIEKHAATAQAKAVALVLDEMKVIYGNR